MKKLLKVMIAVSMIAVLAGCGSKSEEGKDITFESAEDVLVQIYDSYDEDDKFPVAGGDSENVTMDEPGEFNISNTEELDVMLGFPAAEAGNIDEAASMVHMMNANIFTGAAYHVTDGVNMDELADAVAANILERQWICGTPDTIIIAEAGEYMITAFGEAEIMDTFKDNITKIGINVSVEEPIM